MPTAPSEKPRLIVADSERDANLLFATEFLAPDPFLWYAIPGETGIVVSPLEIARARSQARGGLTVRTGEEALRVWRSEKRHEDPDMLITALSRKAGIRTWHVPDNFPLGLATRLEKAGIHLKVVSPFFPEREIKRANEVARIEAGVRLAEAGLYRALEVLREAKTDVAGFLQWQDRPLTAEILRGEIDGRIAQLGGTASHTIAAPGVQGANPHAVGTGPIQAGQPIILDIFPRVDATGYFGDLTRTVVKGQAGEIVHRAFATVLKAQQAALAAIAPGVSGPAVHAAAADVISEAGFVTDVSRDTPIGFFHGTGHGLGLEIHEEPRLSRKSRTVLSCGHVVTVEPGIYYPEWGGVRLEDVVVVTDGGCRNLTVAPKLLEIP